MDPRSAREIVAYARSLDCIHCGLCLRSCPTYRLTGREAASPRGRIHLMRAVAEGRLEPDREYADEMERCLVCRHCESVCPAGVQFGAMMEVARDGLPRGPLARLLRWIGLRLVLPRRAALSACASALRLAQRTGALALAARLAPRRAGLAAWLPAVPPRAEREPLPARTAARGAPRGIVLLLEGCVQRELFGQVNRATAAALAELGIESRPLEGVVCCGSLHAHNGDQGGARELARRMIRCAEASGELPVVVNSAGCGSHMKTLGHLFDEEGGWHARAEAFAARVRDFSETAAPALAAAGRSPCLSPTAALPAPLAWDDPCHLCHGQGVRAEPRAILDAIGGLERVELAESESCCGSAGLYSLLQPESSAGILRERLDALRASGARTLVTANPGCQLQWTAGTRAAGLDVRVVHLAEILAAALPSERPGT